MGLARRVRCESHYDHSKIAFPPVANPFLRGDPMRMRVTRSASACLIAAAALVVATAGELNAQSTYVQTPICRVERTSTVNAQSTFAPYYGKNLIHYDKFDWHIYKTDHFEIYY